MDNIQNNIDMNSEITKEEENLNQQTENEVVEQPQNSVEEEKTEDSQTNTKEVETAETAVADVVENEEIEYESDSKQDSDTSINQNIIEDLQKQIQNLKTQLANETEQNNANKSQYLRIVADFENFRRRTAKEKEELEQLIKKKTINELLPVVDNFERARTQIKPANEGEMGIHKSYQGVYKNLVDSLKKIGVSAMRPEGKPFDPMYHEAMLREPSSEYPEGTVIEQLVRGYLLNEEVLRHAMVKVASAPEDSSSDDSDSSDN